MLAAPAENAPSLYIPLVFDNLNWHIPGVALTPINLFPTRRWRSIYNFTPTFRTEKQVIIAFYDGAALIYWLVTTDSFPVVLYTHTLLRSTLAQKVPVHPYSGPVSRCLSSLMSATLHRPVLVTFNSTLLTFWRKGFDRRVTYFGFGMMRGYCSRTKRIVLFEFFVYFWRNRISLLIFMYGKALRQYDEV